jgi:hypothetical protein
MPTVRSPFRAMLQATPIREGTTMAGTLDIRDAGRGNRWRIAVWGSAALLLLLPALAMQFTHEVAWDAADFIVIGAMLLAACVAFEIASRMARSNAYRLAALVAIGAGFVLVWMNLAVGIIGNEDNPANLLFAGVLVVGLAGSLIAQLKPAGMARAMAATAIAQGAVGVYALHGAHVEAVVLTLFFVAIWLASAHLFRRAARAKG